MAITTRDIIKTWFETGDYPTEEQFWATWDSYWHKLDTITMQDVQGLLQVLQSKADRGAYDFLLPVVLTATAQWQVPAGTWIQRFLIVDPNHISFSIGTLQGQQDIAEAIDITEGWATIATDKYFANPTTIYFNGITDKTVIKIIRA